MPYGDGPIQLRCTLRLSLTRCLDKEKRPLVTFFTEIYYHTYYEKWHVVISSPFFMLDRYRSDTIFILNTNLTRFIEKNVEKTLRKFENFNSKVLKMKVISFDHFIFIFFEMCNFSKKFKNSVNDIESKNDFRLAKLKKCKVFD